MHPPHAILSCIHHMHEPSCAMQNPPTPPCFTPRDRSTDPFARHAPFLHQQPTLHFTQPTSIEHTTATNTPPGPPSNTPSDPPINHIHLPTSNRPTRPQSITPSATSKQPTLPSTMPCHVLPHPHDPAPLSNSTFVLLPPPPPLSAIPPETPFVEQERRSALDIGSGLSSFAPFRLPP